MTARHHGLMPGLQALRFMAAFGVFAHHLVIYAQRAEIIPSHGLEFVRYGASGVTVFFALSGFLMAMLSEDAKPGQFLLRRALRIYPGFWLAVAIAVAIQLIALGGLPRSYNWLAALTLVPAGAIRYPLNIEWTLVFEVFFYCVVAALCLLPRLARQVVVAAWAVAILLFGAPDDQGFVLGIALSQYNLAFIGGMLVWWLRDQIALRGAWFFLASLALLVASRALLPIIGWLPFYIGVSTGAALMVLAASRAKMFAPTGLFKRLGDASYGMYLIHAVLLWTCFSFIAHPSWVAFAMVGAAALMLAITFGTLEHRMHGWLQSRSKAILRGAAVSAATR